MKVPRQHHCNFIQILNNAIYVFKNSVPTPAKTENNVYSDNHMKRITRAHSVDKYKVSEFYSILYMYE